MRVATRNATVCAFFHFRTVAVAKANTFSGERLAQVFVDGSLTGILVVMRTRLPKPGDVMRVMSRDDSVVYGYYVKAWEGNGPLVEFYECPTDGAPKDGLAIGKKLFGPILVGVNPPVRDGSWAIVGKIPIGQYRPPLFLMMGAPLWWVYDGAKERPIGERDRGNIKN